MLRSSREEGSNRLDIVVRPHTFRSFLLSSLLPHEYIGYVPVIGYICDNLRILVDLGLVVPVRQVVWLSPFYLGFPVLVPVAILVFVILFYFDLLFLVRVVRPMFTTTIEPTSFAWPWSVCVGASKMFAPSFHFTMLIIRRSCIAAACNTLPSSLS